MPMTRTFAALAALLTLAACTEAAQPPPTQSPEQALAQPEVSTPAPAARAVRFSEAGNPAGPDVILVAGLASDSAVWVGTVEALGADYHLHLADVAGMGGNAAAAASPTLDGIAAALAKQAATLDRPVLVGHSMGSVVSLLAAVDAPVAGVISVDSLPFYSLLFNPEATVATATPVADAMRAQTMALSESRYASMVGRGARIYAKSPEAVTRIALAARASDRNSVADLTHALMTWTCAAHSRMSRSRSTSSTRTTRPCPCQATPFRHGSRATTPRSRTSASPASTTASTSSWTTSRRRFTPRSNPLCRT